MSVLRGPVLAFSLFLIASSQAPSQPPATTASIAGTWDTVWMTRRGPKPSGYLVIVQNGRNLTAEIHGKGSVKVRGTVDGPVFTLRGSRMMVPYTLSGRWQGDQLQGALKVLSTEFRFTGTRRR